MLQRSAEGCQKSWTSRCSRSPESTSCCLLCHHLHTMSLGTHSRQGNTGRPRSEAALLESKLDDSWIANPEAFSCCCMLPHTPPPSVPGPDSGKPGSGPRAP